MMEQGAREDARRVALVVHAMPDMDREWLLLQLRDSQRHVLQPLLQELQALGIPRPSGLLEDVQGAAGAQALEREAQADALCRLLEAEPLRLTVALASLRDWPLAVRFAARLDPQRRSAALLETDQSRPAPAFRDALVQAVQQALSEAPADVKQPKRAGWRRIVDRVRRRFA